jgi:5,10-methylenetetrahydromethanopterin reductase
MKVDIALEPEYNANEIAELGALAETNGIETIWVTNDPQARDLFMLYTKLAEATSRVRLGVMAVSPMEIHPIKLAASLHTLNEMSNGRAALVVGAGGAITANTRLDMSRRVRAVRECIDIIKRADGDEPLAYDGEIYPVWNYRLRWAVDPAPRVLAGANQEQMLKMSARAADGIHMSDMPLPLVPNAVQTVETALAMHNRSTDGIEFNNFWAFHVKHDRREAELEARSRLVLRGMLKRNYIDPFLSPADVDHVRAHMPSFYEPFYKRAEFYDRGGTFKDVPEPIVDKLVRSLTITAATDELDDHLETLGDFADAGLTHITLGLHDDPADAIRIIGERVVPEFEAA